MRKEKEEKEKNGKEGRKINRREKNEKKKNIHYQSLNTLLRIRNIHLYALLHLFSPYGDVCRVRRVSATCSVCAGQA